MNDSEMTINGHNAEMKYRYWIIPQHNLEAIEKYNNIQTKLQGLLLYHGQEFIRKDEYAQPVYTAIKLKKRQRGMNQLLD